MSWSCGTSAVPAHHESLEHYVSQGSMEAGQVLTALELRDKAAGRKEALARQMTPNTLLQPQHRRLSPDVLDKPLGQDTTPPGLDGDSRLPQAPVLIDSHPAAHVLLHDGDHRV